MCITPATNYLTSLRLLFFLAFSYFFVLQFKVWQQLDHGISNGNEKTKTKTPQGAQLKTDLRHIVLINFLEDAHKALRLQVEDQEVLTNAA